MKNKIRISLIICFTAFLSSCSVQKKLRGEQKFSFGGQPQYALPESNPSLEKKVGIKQRKTDFLPQKNQTTIKEHSIEAKKSRKTLKKVKREIKTYKKVAKKVKNSNFHPEKLHNYSKTTAKANNMDNGIGEMWEMIFDGIGGFFMFFLILALVAVAIQAGIFLATMGLWWVLGGIAFITLDLIFLEGQATLMVLLLLLSILTA